MRPLRIGLTDKQRQSSLRLLNVSLANEVLLQIKTKKIHWDIVGPQFMTLHALLDEQYEAIALYGDEIAERVRQLGGYPVGTAVGFLELAKVKEHPGKVLPSTESIAILLDDHETLTRTLRAAAGSCEKDIDDRGTADFFTGLMQKHEKHAWMLRSFIEGEPVQPDGDVALPQASTATMA